MSIEKASTAMQYGGSGVAMYFGLTPSDWSVVGIIGGLLVGVAGVVVKAAIDWHFKAAHLKLAQDRAAVLAAGEDA